MELVQFWTQSQTTFFGAYKEEVGYLVASTASLRALVATGIVVLRTEPEETADWSFERLVGKSREALSSSGCRRIKQELKGDSKQSNLRSQGYNEMAILSPRQLVLR